MEALGWVRCRLAPLALAAVLSFAPPAPLAAEVANPIDPASIYVLAVASCPPWRDKIKICAPDLAKFVDTAKAVMGVSADHVTILVDENATAPAVRAAFAKLKDSLPQGSTLIVYYIGHGMLVPARSGGGDETEEALILWSASSPFAAIHAVHSGMWMTGSELSGLIDELPAKDILVILDTCNASGADDEIAPKPVRFASKEIALIASSRAHEIAFADLTSAAFTRNLLAAIRSKPPTLYEAFLTAQKETSAEAAIRCEAAATSGAIDEACTPQDPELFDPSGLTKRIELRNE